MYQFSDKMDNFDFLDPNLPKNGFWGRNFKNLSLDSESTPPKYYGCQFSVKMDNFKFFSLNLGKLPNYVQYFGSNIVEGVAESWMEVDEARWRWVHSLVIPFDDIFKNLSLVASYTPCYIVNGVIDHHHCTRWGWGLLKMLCLIMGEEEG